MILSRSKETALLDSSQARREGKHLKSMRLKQSLLRCSTKPSKYAKHESKSLSSRSFSLPIRPHASTFHPLKCLLKYQLPYPSGSAGRILYWAADKTVTWPMIVPIRP